MLCSFLHLLFMAIPPKFSDKSQNIGYRISPDLLSLNCPFWIAPKSHAYEAELATNTKVMRGCSSYSWSTKLARFNHSGLVHPSSNEFDPPSFDEQWPRQDSPAFFSFEPSSDILIAVPFRFWNLYPTGECAARRSKNVCSGDDRWGAMLA